MRETSIKLALVLLATTAIAGVAQAQASYPCVNDAPNPYNQVKGWEQMPRHWAPTNNVYVDAKDNVWVMDRCEAKGCAGSKASPIWELSPDGEMTKNFGAGMFAFPHTVKPDAEGNKPIQYGLIAEEVAQVYPELVIRDESGGIQGVRYEELAPMLLSAVQGQRDQLRALNEQLAAQSAQLAALQRLVATMQPPAP